MKIFCDESGFTGDDLLQRDQPYFTYSAVQLDDDVTNEIIEYIHSNYNVQNKNEIKGKNLVQNSKGQKVIKYLFETYKDRVKLVFHDKKYALAGKIVEYGVEPYLRSNSMFYRSKLHIYLTSGFYLDFIIKTESATEIFHDFVSLARRKIRFEESIFNSETSIKGNLKWMFDLIQHNPDLLLNEIKYHDKSLQSNWLLDLTTTSLFGLLTDWSKNGEELEVICDDSKVFNNSAIIEAYNKMGLNNSKAEFLGTMIGFNLKDDIINKNSKDEKGLQIADVFSSALNYCLKNKDTEFGKQIIQVVLKDCLCKPESFCIMPAIKEEIKEYSEDKLTFYHRFMYMIYNDVLNS
ncbi:MAG: hypothetical protein COA32_07390 [Fluviicola sp.]|nr:MAG: hypothetical protein COA32_07390 [Fluviicola sp.]